MSRTKKQDAERTIYIGATVPKGLVVLAKERAAKLGITFSKWISEAIRSSLKGSSR